MVLTYGPWQAYFVFRISTGLLTKQSAALSQYTVYAAWWGLDLLAASSTQQLVHASCSVISRIGHLSCRVPLTYAQVWSLLAVYRLLGPKQFREPYS
jgi:hypothetical protein